MRYVFVTMSGGSYEACEGDGDWQKVASSLEEAIENVDRFEFFTVTRIDLQTMEWEEVYTETTTVEVVKNDTDTRRTHKFYLVKTEFGVESKIHVPEKDVVYELQEETIGLIPTKRWVLV